ncbi:MAG: tetratricopeptide repeat protein [Candidatus Hydrogenedentes bacterium]|nr:tetratricopeptide repeat protein [Candidatus Hydrogenedentota bacterium]
MRFQVVLITSALCGMASFAQSLDIAGISEKVAEGLKARDASAAAFGQGNQEEGAKLAETSTKLLREARAEYEANGAGESDDPDALMAYADVLNELGDYDLAEKSLLRAVSIDPEIASAWFKLGQTEGKLGPRAESRAIRALRRAAAIEPKTDITVQANASLGALYQQSGLFDFAREAYERALEQDPTHVGSKLAIASLDAREGKMVKAKAAYDSVEKASSDYAPFITRTLGVALEEFSQSRRWLDDTAESHLAYAELLVRAGRLPEAYWPLNRSLKLNDQDYVGWNLMGSILRSMGQTKGARDAFGKSLALNANQPRTTQVIAELDKELAATASAPAPTEGQAPNPPTTPESPVQTGASAPSPPPSAPASGQ